MCLQADTVQAACRSESLELHCSFDAKTNDPYIWVSAAASIQNTFPRRRSFIAGQRRFAMHALMVTECSKTCMFWDNHRNT